MRLYTSHRNERIDRVISAVENEDVQGAPPKRQEVKKVKEQLEEAAAAPAAATQAKKPKKPNKPKEPKEPSMSLDAIPPGNKLAYVMDQVYGMVQDGALSPEAVRRIEMRAGQAKLARARVPAKFDVVNSLKHIGLIAGVGAAATLGENAYNKLQRRRHYNKMMEANPEMKRMDKGQVNVAYNTLHRFAPSVTRDPFAAGSAVKKMVEYETVDPDTIRGYQSIEKDRESSMMSGVFRSMRQAAVGA